MSRRSSKVLCAQYPSERKPAFRVMTELCEGEDGIYIQKRAEDPAGRAHLERIYANSLDLEDYYSGICVLRGAWRDDALRFPCVAGETLEAEIDVQHFDKERFIAQTNERLAKALSVREQYRVPFETTEAFEAVFGEAALSDVPALNPANIDSSLAAFVSDAEGIYCVDCEWVFHFPVPVDFIRYRALLHLYIAKARSPLSGVTLDEMLSWFGYSEPERAVYWQMELCFRRYCLGESCGAAGDDCRVSGADARVDELERQIRTLTDQNTVLRQQVRDKQAQIRKQGKRIQELTTDYNTIQAAFFWRITKPARVTLRAIKRIIAKNESALIHLTALKNTLRHGRSYAQARKREYLESKRIQEEKKWPSHEKLMKQRAEAFPRDITFSILVPLYNTPLDYLGQMIQSVLDQSYEKWELCLADGSDAEHAAVEEYCRDAARKDGRIRYLKLEKNMGISDNTNACIRMANGEYIALIDHDDMLHPSALYENMKAICGQDADFVYSDESTFHDTPADACQPHYKPDFAPDTLRGYNYICHLSVFRRTLLDEAGGGFRSAFDGSQDYDMILRLTEKAKHIVHIPKVLYYWRGHSGSVASDIGAKAYAIEAAKNALSEHLQRAGLKGIVLDSTLPSTYRIQYEIQGTPLISIIIPNMDHLEDLKRCIDSITDRSTWKNREIIVVENNSRDAETFEYYRSIEGQSGIRIVTWEGNFNFSAICNFGAREARGDYILLLNNDIQVITPDWLEQMLMFAQRSDMGAVGTMLYYPDDTVQHAGVILGLGSLAGHAHRYYARGEYGYAGRMTIAQNLSAVTAACCMIPRRVWERIGGLDESFMVALNDVDMCLRIREAGYLIVWTPYAELYHFESKSRGVDDTPEKKKRYKGEIERFKHRWGDVLKAGDPYYNPNLTLEHEDFSFR